ncbi:PepSY domain-containing protein [Streptomyces sp. NPDC047315]|uniref:PepSY domain-containing protein n=1 Tax=Streptomyces sp. NPDC047315 TaxID=3155142 RepID=UPI003404D6E1
MKRKIVIATAVAAALLTGGAYTAVAATDDPAAAKVPAKVSVDEATKAALAEVPGTVESVDRDDDDNGGWDVEIRGTDGKESEVRVDAESGKVSVTDRDDADDDDRDDDDRDDRDDDRDDAPKGVKVTSQQAADAALALHPGTVTEIDFDDDGWEVEVRGKDGGSHEVHVDAKTAKATPDRDDD